MKFRRGCFTLLALLVLVGACLWFVSFAQEAEEIETESEAEEAGKTLGQGLGTLIIACPSAVLFIVFALLAWRNAVGIRTERRHQEHMETLRQSGQQPPA